MICILTEINNLSMAVSMISSLILLFVLNVTVCNKLTIKEVEIFNYEAPDTENLFRYQIFNEESEAAPIDGSYYEPDGSICIEKGKGIIIGTTFLKELTLKDQFYYSFNSGQYSLAKSYNNDAEGMDGDNLCVLWGTWIPKKDNNNKEVSIYFNFMTKKAEISYRSVFSFHLSPSYGILDVELGFRSLEFGKSDANGNKVRMSDRRFFVNTKCKEQNTGREQFIIRGITHTHQGEGKFKMSVIVDASENREITAYLSDPNRNGLKKENSNIWKRLTCTKTKFEFLKENSKNSDTGLKILI